MFWKSRKNLIVWLFFCIYLTCFGCRESYNNRCNMNTKVSINVIDVRNRKQMSFVVFFWFDSCNIHSSHGETNLKTLRWTQTKSNPCDFFELISLIFLKGKFAKLQQQTRINEFYVCFFDKGNKRRLWLCFSFFIIAA